jgi:gas vesicle protein
MRVHPHPCLDISCLCGYVPCLCVDIFLSRRAPPATLAVLRAPRGLCPTPVALTATPVPPSPAKPVRGRLARLEEAVLRLRHPFAVAVVSTLALIGCGGDGDTTTTTATTTTTNAGGGSAVCAAYAQVQSAGKALRQLDSRSSPDQVSQAAADATTSVKALSSAASQTTSEARSNIKPAVSRFQAQLEGQSIAERLTTIGTALGKLERSLKETANQLKCNA